MVGGGWLGIATIQLSQPSLAGTWAELGNKEIGISCQYFLMGLILKKEKVTDKIQLSYIVPLKRPIWL